MELSRRSCNIARALWETSRISINWVSNQPCPRIIKISNSASATERWQDWKLREMNTKEGGEWDEDVLLRPNPCSLYPREDIPCPPPPPPTRPSSHAETSMEFSISMKTARTPTPSIYPYPSTQNVSVHQRRYFVTSPSPQSHSKSILHFNEDATDQYYLTPRVAPHSPIFLGDTNYTTKTWVAYGNSQLACQQNAKCINSTKSTSSIVD